MKHILSNREFLRSLVSNSRLFKCDHVRIQRGGGTGGPDPPEKSQNIGFLSETGPDPLKITKLPNQHSMLGHHRCWMVFRWRADDGPFIVTFGSSIPSSTKKKKQQFFFSNSDKTSNLDPLRQNSLDPRKVIHTKHCQIDDSN